MNSYYTELGVSESASTDELKKAYKKLALKFHPDKNYGCTESHRKFLAVQKAYQVLSDPVERAWYDRNKDVIEAEEIHTQFVNPVKYHTMSAFDEFNDDSKGFYTVYRNFFALVAQEEVLFTSDITLDQFPTFGTSVSDYETVVKVFYNFWLVFNTSKTFTWADEVSTLQAQNRAESRYLNRINQKIRKAHQKSYNISVRDLVKFLKSNDPRLPKIPKQNPPPISLSQSSNRQNDDDSNKFKNKMKNFDWTKHYENVLGDTTTIENMIDDFLNDVKSDKVNEIDLDGILLENCSYANYKDEVGNECEDFILSIKCCACAKTFKNVSTYLAHIKSKKHKNFLRLANKLPIVSTLHTSGKKYSYETMNSKKDVQKKIGRQNNDEFAHTENKENETLDKISDTCANKDALNNDDSIGDVTDSDLDSGNIINNKNYDENIKTNDIEEKAVHKEHLFDSLSNNEADIENIQNNDIDDNPINEEQIINNSTNNKEEDENVKKTVINENSTNEKHIDSSTNDKKDDEIIMNRDITENQITRNIPPNNDYMIHNEDKGQHMKSENAKSTEPAIVLNHSNKQKNKSKSQGKENPGNYIVKNIDNNDENWDIKKEKSKKRKTQKNAKELSESINKCETCNEVFPSRTKLFNHIKEKKHAVFKTTTNTCVKTKRK